MQTLKIGTSENLGFDEAKALAINEAAKYVNDPMALSWLNRGTGRHSPNVDCCREEGKESWEIYAESRGGTVRVEINNQYVFIFREGRKAQ